MLGYFVKRVLLIIPTVIVVTLVIFLLMASLTGTDTFRMVTYADDAGTGNSVLSQFFVYIWHVLTKFDFGVDPSTRRPITNELLRHYGFTMRMTGAALLLTLLIGVPAGIFAAVRRGSAGDRAVSAVTMVISAVPSFCIAFGFVMFFAVKLRWLNVLMMDKTDYIMPMGTIVLSVVASITRITRTAMCEVLDKQYVTAMRSLGLRNRSVVYRHALKNALVPIVSVISSIVGYLICGCIVVDRFFSLPGLGMYLANAIRSRTTNTVLAAAIFISFTMCCVGVLADAVYLIVNPAMRENVSWRSGRLARGKEGRA
ncbi:MAG: ABC transporter permease [Oscillospiraceae bacterium]|nr:ABC transporter permease [Oscillospiraceae bacterium]